jgi:hypothetical protein
MYEKTLLIDTAVETSQRTVFFDPTQLPKKIKMATENFEKCWDVKFPLSAFYNELYT